MIWEELQKKYPMAYDLMIMWRLKLVPEDQVGEFLYHFRDLYDFFDEMGIHIWVEHGIIDKSRGKCRYDITISELGCMRGGYKTRKEAEAIAFEKSFEFLEQKQ